jgi:seryl-tRNA synthetase
MTSARKLRRDLGRASERIKDGQRRRDDTQAAIRRAEQAGDEAEATRLRREIPRIGAEIAIATADHDRIKAAMRELGEA